MLHSGPAETMNHMKPGSCQSLPVFLFLVLDHCRPICLAAVKVVHTEGLQLDLEITPVPERQFHAAPIADSFAGDPFPAVVAFVERAADVEGIPASCHGPALLRLG